MGPKPKMWGRVFIASLVLACVLGMAPPGTTPPQVCEDQPGTVQFDEPFDGYDGYDCAFLTRFYGDPPRGFGPFCNDCETACNYQDVRDKCPYSCYKCRECADDDDGFQSFVSEYAPQLPFSSCSSLRYHPSYDGLTAEQREYTSPCVFLFSDFPTVAQEYVRL